MALIRELTDSDVVAYVELRRRALLDVPLAFSASPEDDFVGSAEAVREQLRRSPEWTIFGAWAPELAGAAGVFRDRRIKASHKAHIWGVYVLPAHRGRGLGAHLVDAAVQHARTLAGVTWAQLSVSDSTPDARNVYERAGFVVWGTQPEALCHGGRCPDEHFMALRLK